MTTSSSRMAKFAKNASRTTTALLNDRRCIVYVRASTDDQQTTLDSQQFEADKFCAAQGIELACPAFIDSGVSGSKPLLERKQAKAALAYMKQHGVSTFLVMSLDRAFRNTVDMHLTIEHLLDHGYNFRMVSPDLDLRGPVGKLVAGILGELAQFELACRSERQGRGFESMRRSQVARSQNPSFGWDLGEEIPGKLSHSGNPYRAVVPNEQEQAILREIIAMYEAKEKLAHIAEHLNQRGIPTKRAGQTITRKGRQITVSGLWKREHVQSVIAHAELA